MVFKINYLFFDIAVTRGLAKLFAQMNEQRLKVHITRNHTVDRYLMQKLGRRLVSKRRTIGGNLPPRTPKSILRPSRPIEPLSPLPTMQPSRPRRPSIGVRGRRRNSASNSTPVPIQRPIPDLEPIDNLRAIHSKTMPCTTRTFSASNSARSIPSTSKSSPVASTSSSQPTASTPNRLIRGTAKRIVLDVVNLSAIDLPAMDWSDVNLPIELSQCVVNGTKEACSMEQDFPQSRFGQLYYSSDSD